MNVSEDKNIIYICDPIDIFNVYFDLGNKKNIFVNWDDIDVDNMFNRNDYGCYSIIEQVYKSNDNQFSYIKNKLSQKIKFFYGNRSYDYYFPFVIVEQINLYSDITYFVRGIIGCSNDGVRLAVNPQYDNVKTYQKRL